MKNGRYELSYGIYYYKDDKYHRLYGPAIECHGYKFWYKEGEYHRFGGPAREWKNGDKEWYVEGKLHRLDGPAVEYNNGYKEWWIEGKQIECYSKEEFQQYVKEYLRYDKETILDDMNRAYSD